MYMQQINCSLHTLAKGFLRSKVKIAYMLKKSVNEKIFSSLKWNALLQLV